MERGQIGSSLQGSSITQAGEAAGLSPNDRDRTAENSCSSHMPFLGKGAVIPQRLGIPPAGSSTGDTL